MATDIQTNKTDIQALQTGKAEASSLAAHTGNNTIHVTAEDKTKWNTVEDKVDKTAISKTLTSESTDDEVSSAKVVYDGLQKSESDTSRKIGSTTEMRKKIC